MASQAAVAAEGDGNVNASDESAAVEAATTRTVSMFSWDAKILPIKDKRITLFGDSSLLTWTSIFSKRTSRITIDLEQPISSAGAEAVKSMMTMTKDNNEDVSLKDDENILLRIWRKDENVSRQSDRSQRDRSMLKSSGDWTEHCAFTLEEVTVVEAHERTCQVNFGIGRELVTRQVKFESTKDSTSFKTTLEKMTALELERGKRKLEKYRLRQQNYAKTTLHDTDERIRLLVEIASVNCIPKNAAPYIAVKMGGKVIHRTEHVSSDGRAIWTLDDKCFFLLNMSLLEFFGSTGMTFLVKDQDSIAFRGEPLGRVDVPLERLVDATGGRESYDLVPTERVPEGAKLSIRVRRASADDIEFMNAYKEASKQSGVFMEESFLPIRPPHTKILGMQHKLGKGGEKMHRVKPFPDPDRPDDTKWMTTDQIENEALKPSSHWVEAGSGTLGRVYIEVIGCDDLPNMDSISIDLSNRTDAFACLVFEDSIVNTDVVPRTLKPRWPPWCRRAFAFNVLHPSSNVMLGLFDYDPESSPLQHAMSFASDVHDPIGRMMINVADAFPDVTYTLEYPLYFGKSVEHRQEPRGTITIRLRKELFNFRKAVVVGMKPPPMTYVSVARQIDFAVAHYTTEGDENEKAYSIKTFTGYIQEIESYKVILDYVKAAAFTVLFWRAHYRVTLAGKDVMLPLHSLTAFTWGVLVTYNFDLFPSFLLFSIGWIMLACNDQARKAPSPWHQARSYSSLLRHVLLGQTHTESIAVNEGAEEMAIYRRQQEEKTERLKRKKEIEADYVRKIKEETGYVDDGGGQDDTIESNRERFLEKVTFNPIWAPFKPTLYPIQKELRTRVLQLRIAASIVTWQERIYAFWITTMAFVAAFVFSWQPWGFVLKWSLRIAVWIVLGPWMAIVARYRFPETAGMTDEELNEEIKKRYQAKQLTALKASEDVQIQKESALKRKALCRWMFGQYHLRVPRFTEDLFPDIPLPSSFSEPFKPDDAPPITIKERIFGQNLYGDMIPRREIQVSSTGRIEDKANVFKEAGLGRYFEESFGWAQFLDVSKVTYVVGGGVSHGRVYAKMDDNDARLVGTCKLLQTCAGWTMGAALVSEIIFFQDEDAYSRFSSGRFEFVAGARVSVISLTADFSVGTDGVSWSAGNRTLKPKDIPIGYHNGMATFIIRKVGVMFDVSIIGQRFSFHPV